MQGQAAGWGSDGQSRRRALKPPVNAWASGCRSHTEATEHAKAAPQPLGIGSAVPLAAAMHGRPAPVRIGCAPVRRPRHPGASISGRHEFSSMPAITFRSSGLLSSPFHAKITRSPQAIPPARFPVQQPNNLRHRSKELSRTPPSRPACTSPPATAAGPPRPRASGGAWCSTRSPAPPPAASAASSSRRWIWSRSACRCSWSRSWAARALRSTRASHTRSPPCCGRRESRCVRAPARRPAIRATPRG